MKELIHIHCPYVKGPGKTWCGLYAATGRMVIYGGKNIKTKMNSLILKSRTFEYAPCEACLAKQDTPAANLLILDCIDL